MGRGTVSTIAAIFDLDGTLYTGHIARGIAHHHRTHRVKRFPLYIYMAIHMPMWGLLKTGLLSESTSRELWARNLGWTIHGWTTEEAAKAFAWITEHYVQPRVRPDMMTQLRDHQAAEHRVILVSGTFAPLLTAIGDQFGVGETVGTPLVIRDGRYTGASELPVCQGRHKVTRLEEYLNRSGDILWTSSYAYADSHTDIPLLARVGHPVAVYPDPRLADHAQEHGWDMIG
jgi:HAD superfamily hydrolase (TIGR01490 family)